MQKIQPVVETSKNRTLLTARAQGLAYRDLKFKYNEEYFKLFEKHKKRLFKEIGWVPPKTRVNRRNK